MAKVELMASKFGHSHSDKSKYIIDNTIISQKTVTHNSQVKQTPAYKYRAKIINKIRIGYIIEK